MHLCSVRTVFVNTHTHIHTTGPYITKYSSCQDYPACVLSCACLCVCLCVCLWGRGAPLAVAATHTSTHTHDWTKILELSRLSSVCSFVCAPECLLVCVSACGAEARPWRWGGWRRGGLWWW
jgi:hypothetical protein